MYKYALTAVVVAAFATVSIMVVTVSRDRQIAHVPPHRVATSSPAARVRSPRPDAADWETIKDAARLRRQALEPNRTAFYRSFSAYMGLSGLTRLHPILPGRCAVAVSYLYNNLLDLRQAYTGEDWTALRQAVATEPSLQVCVPQPSR